MKLSRVHLVGLAIFPLFIGCAPEGTLDQDIAVDESTWVDELDALKPVDIVVRIDPGLLDASPSERSMFSAIAASTTVYLNGEGRVYTAGREDSARGTSGILSYYNLGSIIFPPSSYNTTQWAELMRRTKSYFAAYNVDIVDQRPTAGAYVEIAVGNTYASIIGLPSNVGGIAPLGPCAPIRNAVSYIFHALYDRSGYGGIAGTAEAVAHEIGHTLSLSHESLSSDLMSYAPQSPQKGFQNAESYCGTTPRAESCSCGAATQNSHQQLIRMVGARTTTPDPTPPPPPAEDTTPPTVAITSPAAGTSLAGNATIQVVVEARDNVGVRDVRLFWEFSQQALPCDNTMQGVTCVRGNGRYTWSILAGVGERRFRAIAEDTSGNVTESLTRTITLTGASPQPQPQVDTPPEVSVTRPVVNELLTRGGRVVFQARVSDDRDITDVRATWYHPGGSMTYVLAETTTPGVFQFLTSVSTTATPGTRRVTIEATDSAGHRTVSAPITITIR